MSSELQSLREDDSRDSQGHGGLDTSVYGGSLPKPHPNGSEGFIFLRTKWMGEKTTVDVSKLLRWKADAS